MKQINTFENCIKSIVALEPCYGTKGGNSTRIYTRQGEVFVDNRRLKTILGKMLKYYGYDLVELRKNYKTYLGCGQEAPLPLSHHVAFVPLKMRQPLVENDGASGYISLTDLVKISDQDSNDSGEQAKCRLHLNGGLSVPCCFTRQVIEKRLNQGRLALDHYRYLHSQNGSMKPLPLIAAEQAENGSDLYEKINLISSFIYQFLADVRM